MSEKKQKIPIASIILSLLLITYLIWWDNLDVYSGYYHNDNITDQGAVVAMFLTVIALIYSIIRSIKNTKYFWAIVPLLLFAVYITRIWHGPRVAKYHDCEFSICSDLNFFADGTFYFSSWSQLEKITKSGSVEVRGDTIFLRPGFHFSLDWTDLKIKPGTTRKVMWPVGFSFTFNGEFDIPGINRN